MPARTHGKTATTEYVAWRNAKARCKNPKHTSYARYGGRGITVCPEWAASFERFLTDMGPKPSSSYTLDRINNDGDYTPENTRWIPHAAQARNRSTNRRLAFNGQERIISEWAELTGLSKITIADRIDRAGWTVERALTTPPRPKRDSKRQEQRSYIPPT